LNPVIILPSALENDAASIAEKLVASITTDAGQFCTKPGVILLPENSSTDNFLNVLSRAMESVIPVPMLHRGIHGNFHEGVEKLSSHPAVKVIASKPAEPSTLQGTPHLFLTDQKSFLADEALRHEFFGPLSIFVRYETTDAIEPILRSLSGQLTASVFCNDDDATAASLLPLLGEIAGRVVFNGVPTGVEVNAAIQHGGPWPACSDSRFSAVGPDALLRFVRPVAWQNLPGDPFQRTVG